MALKSFILITLLYCPLLMVSGKKKIRHLVVYCMQAFHEKSYVWKTKTQNYHPKKPHWFILVWRMISVKSLSYLFLRFIIFLSTQIQQLTSDKILSKLKFYKNFCYMPFTTASAWNTVSTQIFKYIICNAHKIQLNSDAPGQGSFKNSTLLNTQSIFHCPV